MPPKLHIKDVDRNAMTGLITLEARIIDEADPVNGTGAVERWHIEALEITTKYNGDSEAWLNHVAREMLNRHRLRTAAHTSLHGWKGKSMIIKEG